MDPETANLKRRENSEDMDTSENNHNNSPIRESFNQFLTLKVDTRNCFEPRSTESISKGGYFS